MGFKEDVATHLVATVAASQEAVVGAVLKTISGLGDSTVLMQGFDDATNTLVVGFKERGGKTLAKAWLHGGLGGPIQAAQRLQQVSPQVSVKIVDAGDGKVSVATKIEHYSYTRVSGIISYNDLNGRLPHQEFLDVISAALKGLDPSAYVAVTSELNSVIPGQQSRPTQTSAVSPNGSGGSIASPPATSQEKSDVLTVVGGASGLSDVQVYAMLPSMELARVRAVLQELLLAGDIACDANGRYWKS